MFRDPSANKIPQVPDQSQRPGLPKPVEATTINLSLIPYQTCGPITKWHSRIFIKFTVIAWSVVSRHCLLSRTLSFSGRPDLVFLFFWAAPSGLLPSGIILWPFCSQVTTDLICNNMWRWGSTSLTAQDGHFHLNWFLRHIFLSFGPVHDHDGRWIYEKTEYQYLNVCVTGRPPFLLQRKQMASFGSVALCFINRRWAQVRQTHFLGPATQFSILKNTVFFNFFNSNGEKRKLQRTDLKSLFIDRKS